MSYSLNCKCHLCKKKTQCVDSVFIQAALSGIHSINYANGTQKQLHLGCGTVEIQCYNFDDERIQIDNK